MAVPEGTLFEGKAVIGVRCAPMNNGSFALLVYTADNQAQASRTSWSRRARSGEASAIFRGVRGDNSRPSNSEESTSGHVVGDGQRQLADGVSLMLKASYA